MSSVSYVVTIYNKAPALPFLIAGLAAQRGDFEREFIFVDDGSTDDSDAVLRQLTAGWSDVTIINQANTGPAPAFNAGVRRARGGFIKPVDGDDMLLPWATARLLAAIEATGCNVALGRCGPSFDITAAPPDLVCGADQAAAPIERWDDILHRSFLRSQGNPTCWLARAATVRDSGGCDERVFIQDYSIELRLAERGGFARMNEPIFRPPAALPGKLSDNEAQILHDLNLALGYFLTERPGLPRSLARLGFVRAAARAWAWARRRGGKSVLSREFCLVCGARLRFFPPSAANVRATCAAFTETNSIRLGDGRRTSPG